MTNSYFPETFAGHLVLSSSVVLITGFVLAFIFRSGSAAQQERVWRSVFLMLFLLPLTWAFRPFALLSEPPASLPAMGFGTQDAASTTRVPLIRPDGIMASFPTGKGIVGIWAAGAVLLSLRAAGGLYWRKRWLKSAVPCQDPAVLGMWDRIDPDGAGRLMISTDCRMPLTWGKVVLLPKDALAWPVEQVEAALHHEAAHLERKDACYRAFGEVAVAIFWPHPLVWLARRLWHRSQEQSCDDAVLRAGTDPVFYADLLCAAARIWTRQAPGALSMAQPSSLEYRLRAVLNPDCRRGPCSRGWSMGSAIAIGLAFGTAALAQQKPENPILESGTPPRVKMENPEGREKSKVPAATPDRTAIAAQIKYFQQSLDVLNKASADALIEACIKAGVNDVTIRSLAGPYQRAQSEYTRMRQSGYGRKHPRVLGLDAEIRETRKILLIAAGNYRMSLAVTLRNLERELKALE